MKHGKKPSNGRTALRTAEASPVLEAVAQKNGTHRMTRNLSIPVNVALEAQDLLDEYRRGEIDGKRSMDMLRILIAASGAHRVQQSGIKLAGANGLNLAPRVFDYLGPDAILPKPLGDGKRKP